MVGALAFFETAAFVGLVVPGETAVVAAGVVASRGEVELVPLVAVVWLAAAAGDTASFLLGRGLGRPFLDAHGARLRLDAKRLARVEGFYERHGGKAVIAGRFVGIARAVTPFLAGAARFPFRRFVTYSLLGALAWAAFFTLAGYAFSNSIAGAGDTATRIALGGVLIITAVLVLLSGTRSRRGGRRARRRVCRDVDERRRHHGRPGSGKGDAPAAEPQQRSAMHGTGRAAAILVVVNGRASAASARSRLVDEVAAGLAAQGRAVDAVVTYSEEELSAALASAAGRRVVLVGGDGSLHAAANATLRELPELALIPAGRANNIARALGIPTDPARATALAANAQAPVVGPAARRDPRPVPVRARGAQRRLPGGGSRPLRGR